MKNKIREKSSFYRSFVPAVHPTRQCVWTAIRHSHQSRDLESAPPSGDRRSSYSRRLAQVLAVRPGRPFGSRQKMLAGGFSSGGMSAPAAVEPARGAYEVTAGSPPISGVVPGPAQNVAG